MDISQLPRNRFPWGNLYDFGDIAYVIEQELIYNQAKALRFWSPVTGAPGSIRLFSTMPHLDSVPLPRPMRAQGITQELQRMTTAVSGGARYPQQTSPKHIKGWEISRAMIDGQPVLVCAAVWVAT